MARLHDHHLEARLAQAPGQPLGERAGFQADCFNLFTKTTQAGDYLINVRRQALLKPNLAILINDAQSQAAYANIQSCI